MQIAGVKVAIYNRETSFTSNTLFLTIRENYLYSFSQFLKRIGQYLALNHRLLNKMQQHAALT